MRSPFLEVLHRAKTAYLQSPPYLVAIKGAMVKAIIYCQFPQMSQETMIS